MQTIQGDIAKLARTLNGKERAKLIIKDAHYKNFVDKKGFLSESDVQQLLYITDPQVSKDYRFYCDIYDRMSVIMGVVTESYLKFKYHFEALRKAHLLLNYAPALEHLKTIIEKNVKDKDEKAQADEILDVINPLEKKAKGGKYRLKHPLENIKENVERAYINACYFVSMKKIVEKVTDLFGFSPFIGKDYERTYANYIEEVGLCIKEHNEIMRRAGEEINLEKPETYFIKTPDFNTTVYDEWHEALFKEKPTSYEEVEL